MLKNCWQGMTPVVTLDATKRLQSECVRTFTRALGRYAPSKHVSLSVRRPGDGDLPVAMSLQVLFMHRSSRLEPK